MLLQKIRYQYKPKKNITEYTGYLLIGLAITYCFLFLLYSDNLINSQVGYEFISSIFQGTLKEYFNSSSWSYGLTIYTIYAVWSIPVWLVFRVFGFSLENLTAIPVLLWYKLLLAVFALWSVYLIGKIAEEIYGGLKREVQLQYMCSVFFVFPVFYIAQCDIMGLCFVLLGTYYYIKEENKKFLVSFAIAMTMKYFALLVFIPLVLFRYRKIRKLFSIFLAGIALIGISMVIISASSTGKGAIANGSYYVNEHIERFSEITIVLHENLSIGLLGFFYTALCVLAYIIPNDDKEQNKRYAVWLVLAGYLNFFLFYMCNFYWYVLLAPFITLAAFHKLKYTKAALLLVSIFEVMTGICHAFLREWVFMGPTAYSYLFLRKYGENVTENGVLFCLEEISDNLFYDGWNWRDFIPVWNGIAYASILAVLILSFPGFMKRINKEEEKDKVCIDLKEVTGIRIIIIYLWLFVSLYCLVSSQ